jgi:thiol peroxidase
VTFFGEPVELSGTPPRAGEMARDFTVHRFSPEEGIIEVTLADLLPKPRLLNVVPSLDTPVCSSQTRSFSERIRELGPRVVAYTISVDLPFAQHRFCGAEHVDNVVSLSDYRTRSFGTSWGLLMTESQLLARSVFVLDPEGKIRYAQIVSEVTEHPAYDPALEALAAVAARG